MASENNKSCGSGCGCHSDEGIEQENLFNRRTLLKGAGATLGIAAFAKALAPITEWTKDISVDEFLQKHYRELDKSELAAVIKRIEAETKEDYGKEVTISAPQAQKGVKFAYALNLSICVGCRRCAEACHIEIWPRQSVWQLLHSSPGNEQRLNGHGTRKR